jgi:hypothetical protein
MKHWPVLVEPRGAGLMMFKLSTARLAVLSLHNSSIGTRRTPRLEGLRGVS